MSNEIKKCPICGEDIKADAVHCNHCDCSLESNNNNKTASKQTANVGDEQVSSENKSDLALWNPSVAVSWSLLFFPIFGALIQAKNWKALGDEVNEKQSMLWVYGSIVFSIVFIFLPDSLSFGPAIVFLLVWYFVFGKKQLDYIKENKVQYTKKTWGKPVGIGAVCLALYIVFSGIFSGYDESDLQGHWVPDLDATVTIQVERAQKAGKNITLQECDQLKAVLEQQLGDMEISFSDNIMAVQSAGNIARSEFEVIEYDGDSITIKTDQKKIIKILFTDSEHINFGVKKNSPGVQLKWIGDD